MGKKQRDNNSGNTSNSIGGLAGRKNVLAAKNEGNVVNLKNSRILCVCQARIHELVMNCLGCGRIICAQEGSGPCLTCGTLVCTLEEKEIINLGTKRSRELLEKLNAKGVSQTSESQNSSYQNATEFRDRLLRADADTEHRTRVNDLQSDYSNAESSPFLSATEREALKQRREELRILREKERKRFVVSIDLDGGVVEQVQDKYSNDIGNDPIIHSILEKADDRRRAQETAFNNSSNASWSPIGFVPKYLSESGHHFEPKSDGDVIDAESLMIVSDEIAAQVTEQKGWTIALPQPIATFIVNGVIKFIRWEEDLLLKGPLFVVSKTGSTNEKDIADFSKQYVRDVSKIPDLDFADGAVLGRAYLEECLYLEDFYEKYGSNSKIPGSGNYVLHFTVFEPLLKTIPHIPTSDIYEMDRQLKKSLARW